MTDTVEWLKDQGALELARHQELMEKYGHLSMMSSLDKLDKLEMYVIRLKLAAWAVIETEGGPDLLRLEDGEENGPWQTLLDVLGETKDG